MLVRVLGDLQVDADGTTAEIGSRNQRIVLAVLAARAGVAVPGDTLADAIWGTDLPRTAVGSLRTYVSRLRRLLGERLAIGPAGYTLDLPETEIDAGRFERLVDRAAHAGPADALTILDEALALWRGDAFGDVADVEAVRPASIRLAERRVAAREARAAALLAAGRAGEAVGAAEELVAEHPLREGAWAVLVEALASTARAPEALRAYQRAVGALTDVGLAPSERLRRAETVALAHEAPGLGPRPLAVVASSLVGRDADVAAVGDLLARHRAVTLVGPGGVGKTRLAMAVAAGVSSRFEWGARLVRLGAVSDPAAVADVIADELGLAVEAGAPERALARVGRLDLLVVLDNCEHLAEAAAAAAETICAGGAPVRLLATSREPLGVAGEHLWPVTPLEAGTAGSPGYDLFVERARAARPGFRPGGEDERAIARIVRRLDGLPLAIEMAAARVATMPVAELERRLDDELTLLVSRRRHAEERHRTLAAVAEWSVRLLDADERRLFADMAVFEGPVQAADVAAVTGHPDPLELLSRLAERSLLVADTSGTHAHFGMLRTIRGSASRLLDPARAAELARRHVTHLASVFAACDRDLWGPGEAEAHDRIEGLLGEARAAQAWAARHDTARAVRLCGALYLFGQSRARDEVLGWGTSLAAQLGPNGDDPDPDPDPGLAVVLTAAAHRAVNGGDLTTGLTLARDALRLAGGDERVRALAYEIVSDVHIYAGRLVEGEEAAQAGMEAARSAGDVHGVVANLANLALAAAYGGDRDRAVELIAAIGDDESAFGPSHRAWLRYTEGEAVLDRDPPRALEALDEAVALADSVGNRYLGGVARVSATSLRARAGDQAAAAASFAEVIEHWRGQGDQLHQLTTLRNLVVLLQRLGRPAETAELLGAVRGVDLAPTFGEEAARLDAAAAWIADTLGAAEAEALVAAGGRRTVDEAAVVALRWLATVPPLGHG